MDVTQEIEQRAQQAAQAGAEHCALYSISWTTFHIPSLYRPAVSRRVCLKEYLLGSIILILEICKIIFLRSPDAYMTCFLIALFVVSFMFC